MAERLDRGEQRELHSNSANQPFPPNCQPNRRSLRSLANLRDTNRKFAVHSNLNYFRHDSFFRYSEQADAGFDNERRIWIRRAPWVYE